MSESAGCGKLLAVLIDQIESSIYFQDLKNEHELLERVEWQNGWQEPMAGQGGALPGGFGCSGCRS